MPGRDRTGPQGMGPMTGRRMGDCAGNDDETSVFRSFGRGRGFGGRGRGAGFRSRGGFGYGRASDNHPMGDKTSIEQEVKVLKSQLAYLEGLLKNKDENQNRS